jgi:ABC-2 type transport system ATP-binding protein
MIKDQVLNIERLCIAYGKQDVVKNVSLAVYSGEIFGLLGPNGAGKTSIMSAIEGLIKPSSRTITVCGYDINENPLNARANMGVQLQSTGFQPELSIKEIVILYSGLYGIKHTPQALNNLFGQIKLEDSMDKRFAQLSGGQQQRLSLCLSTIHNPSLILLDEPTTGLDPQSRRQLWDRMEEMRNKGHSILLTTHSMEEAEAICDRVAIIDKGNIIDTDKPQSLIARYCENNDVISVSRHSKITLEDVFIGLTGTTLRS